MKTSKLLCSLSVLLAFVLAYWGSGFLNIVSAPVLSMLVKYLWWFVPTIMVVLLSGKAVVNYFTSLTSVSGFLKALLFSLVCVLPMLVSSALWSKLNLEQGLVNILHKSLLAGLMEEYLFRGFLFGMLFFVCNWGFIPAALIGSLVFGAGHLYQGASAMQSLGIFMITAMGAGWFAWLLVEWKANLWVPILLHGLMNLSWILFDISGNALGGVLSNVFRAITIALSIVLTLRLNKAGGFRLRPRQFWSNNES